VIRRDASCQLIFALSLIAAGHSFRQGCAEDPKPKDVHRVCPYYYGGPSGIEGYSIYYALDCTANRTPVPLQAPSGIQVPQTCEAGTMCTNVPGRFLVKLDQAAGGKPLKAVHAPGDALSGFNKPKKDPIEFPPPQGDWPVGVIPIASLKVRFKYKDADNNNQMVRAQLFLQHFQPGGDRPSITAAWGNETKDVGAALDLDAAGATTTCVDDHLFEINLSDTVYTVLTHKDTKPGKH